MSRRLATGAASNVSEPAETGIPPAQTADHDAWGELVDAFASAVWAVASQATGSDDQAAEVCAITWRRLADQLPSLPPASIGPWLRRTASRESDRLLRLTSA
jgi:DNA-directed RNA polymerase specialized sigma24 family protein